MNMSNIKELILVLWLRSRLDNALEINNLKMSIDENNCSLVFPHTSGPSKSGR